MSSNAEPETTPEEGIQGQWRPDDKGNHMSANLIDCGSRPSWQVDEITTTRSDSALVDAAERGEEPPDFRRELASAYARLAEGQEPLGREFEAVLEKNKDLLFES